MLHDTRAGRHRAPARYNPLAELTTIARSAGQSGAKASAVLAASGGLVAAFAIPAHAADVLTGTTAAAAPTAVAASTEAPTPAPDVAAVAPAVLAPAVVAPAGVSPAGAPVVGIEGVRVVAKPKPKPVVAEPTPVVRTTSPARPSTRSTASRASTTVAQSSSQIVNIARRYLGIPYVYGGSTPAGFDCSGFTQFVFGKAGISIPRTASAQQNAARPVSDPRPGDLVFFGSPAWHVGIYTGNGMMIDSPREGKSTSERPIFSGVSGYGRF